MKDNNEKILENVILKISISNFEKEEKIEMTKTRKNILKIVAVACCTIFSITGVVFATNKVIEKIWNTPTKVEYSKEITEEMKKENISLEVAQKLAIEKLTQIGFDANIVRTDEYRHGISNEIMYRFYTEDEYQIEIRGKTGDFYDIWDESKKSYNDNTLISEEEAIHRANYFYKLFGFKDGEYEMTKVWVNNHEGSGKGMGQNVNIEYNKKYDGIINPFESISITVEAGTDRLCMLRVENHPFDNNEVLITEQEAIQIALEEDKKIETNEIERVHTKLMVVGMNTNAYERINNKEEYYKSMQSSYPREEKNYYSVEEKIRNAWVVVITYVDNYGSDVVKRYTEGQFSYFVDATTGEIIGGRVLDATYSS